MRKVSILLIAVLVLTIAGCQVKAPVDQTAKNGNGTVAVNIQGSKATAPPVATPSVAPTDNPAIIAESNSFPAADSSVPTNNGNIIEIKEKMFVAQTNDIYYNAEDYLGKTIKYEGIFQSYTWEENGATYYSVIRFGPGCCGSDGECGFEVKWADGRADYPNQDDWVEAVGVLVEYEEDGYQYLQLALTALTVLDTRGAEYVEQ
ncbi:hypothetical protein FACS189499_09460 [Clostridia bacterium]|nr:hypothetical protein FACS189499_09460 [Clostridia bacterium]